MLEVFDVHSYYGLSYILQGVSLRVGGGEIVALIGRNGAGKTTTLKSIMGIVKPAQGSVVFKGKELRGLKSYQIARLGIGYVPEDRRIYSNLTLTENIEMGQMKPGKRGAGWTIERIYELFPNLKALGGQRLGGNMSGGEQQLLAIARTLMGNPEFILLDEPSEGLAPIIVSTLANTINGIKAEGVNMLLSEQNMRFAQKIAERCYIIDRGKICFEGRIDELMSNEALLREHLTL